MKKLSAVKDYLMELAFLALLVRVVAVGCGVGEAIALVSLVSSIAYSKYLVKSKIDDKAEMEAKFENIVTELNKRIDEVNNKIGTVSLNNSVKRTSVNEPQDSQIKPLGATPKRYF